MGVEIGLMSILADFDWNLLRGNEEILVPVTVFGVGLIIAITAIVGHYWRRERQAGYDAELKRTMLERGMSAEDIERVIRATGTTEDDSA